MFGEESPAGDCDLGKRREKEDVSIGLGDLEVEVSEDSVVLGVDR